MIFDSHISDHLAPYLDGELDERARLRVDLHLAQCVDCRGDLEQVRSTMAILSAIPVVEAPATLWTAIEAAANAESQPARFPFWRLAAAAMIAIVALAGYWSYTRQPAVRWKVVALQGSPVAGKEPIATTGSVANGEWIETGASSRARITVGDIGSVEVEPNTRVRLVASGAAGYRLALSSGGISASISAPPRLFIVDTPAATAVDLGCEYQVHCDRAGTGMLNVSRGWVLLEWRGTESLVPAGASCRMRAGVGPGTPWFDDASAELVQALERFDLNPNSGPEPVDTILSRSRARDTLTLWHLLSRVTAADRARVYQRMVQFSAPPASITKEQILRLDRQALLHWKDELAWTW